ncbi:MAG: hypothetical protein LBL33_09715 [Tannerella sp.]|jgi:hypothetical protein|nr:hypothetical protein [Tannerella sp.]
MKSVYESITSLSATYDLLNRLWKNDTCSLDRYQALRQEEYKKAFDTLNQFRFEELILQIVSESLNRAVLVRLQALIKNCIRIYESKENIFNGLDFLALCRIDEQEEFADRFALLQQDLKDIQEYEYPSEQEKQMLLAETRQEINGLQNEKADYVRERKWIVNNYYSEIYQISKSYLNIICDYFPRKEEKTANVQETATPVPINEIAPEIEIAPDMIFRARMYERFLLLEQKLISDQYLNENLRWVSAHGNKKADIKSLIIFLTGLQASNYFLPNRDSKIKQYFETRYHIKIGQNFERKRRETLAGDYKVIFHDYPF